MLRTHRLHTGPVVNDPSAEIGHPVNRTLTTLLMAAGFALNAHAQLAPDAVKESTDPAKAEAVEREAREIRTRAATQPQGSADIVRGQADGGIAFMSGGNSVEHRMAMHAERGRYGLWVATVAKPSGAYLAEARLSIVNLKDKTVALQRTMEGPWLLASLAPGRYEVSATYRAEGSSRDETLTERVDIAKSGQRQVIMRFASPAQVSSEMDSPFKGNPFAKPAAQHK
jgi:hypothetical protein